MDCCLPDLAPVETDDELFARALAPHPDRVPPPAPTLRTSHVRAG